MTLEEKFNRNSRYKVKFNPTAGNNFLYKDGNIISVEEALDDINNLLGVMEEMKEALETVSVWHMNLSHTTDINHRAKRVLSKYNELFKK